MHHKSLPRTGAERYFHELRMSWGVWGRARHRLAVRKIRFEFWLRGVYYHTSNAVISICDVPINALCAASRSVLMRYRPWLLWDWEDTDRKPQAAPSETANCD